MSDPPPLLAFSGITRRYGTGDAEVRALDGVDMTIAAAEFVAIMGPSGSGKSTAMNLLGCLDVPSEGTYRFMGADVGALSRDQRALLRRTYIGFVFQGFNLLPRTPAVENVELPLIYKGIPRARRRAMALDALAKVGLEDRAKHDPSELSGGQQQRVAIARAIVSRPAVIMADEPTGNLDTVTSREIMDLLTRFNVDEGITIVMVTHEPDMAEYASRVIHFRDGRIERDLSNRKVA
jgi:putative ABC transport system ATP-binding protein